MRSLRLYVEATRRVIAFGAKESVASTVQMGCTPVCSPSPQRTEFDEQDFERQRSHKSEVKMSIYMNMWGSSESGQEIVDILSAVSPKGKHGMSPRSSYSTSTVWYPSRTQGFQKFFSGKKRLKNQNTPPKKKPTCRFHSFLAYMG